MQKKIVLIPIAAIIGLGAGIPGGMLHSNLVQANYRQQQLALQKQEQLRKAAEKKEALEKAELAKERENKSLPIDITAKNDQIAVKATEIQTGQVLYSGGPKAKHRYVVIHLTITNHGTNALMFQRDDFKLRTDHGTVEQSKLVTKDKIIDKTIVNKPIAVGAKMTAYIAFDSAGAEDKDKTLIISNSYNNSFKKPLSISLAGSTNDTSASSSAQSTGSKSGKSSDKLTDSSESNSGSSSSQNVLSDSNSGSSSSAKGGKLK